MDPLRVSAILCAPRELHGRPGRENGGRVVRGERARAAPLLDPARAGEAGIMPLGFKCTATRRGPQAPVELRQLDQAEPSCRARPPLHAAAPIGLNCKSAATAQEITTVNAHK